MLELTILELSLEDRTEEQKAMDLFVHMPDSESGAHRSGTQVGQYTCLNATKWQTKYGPQ